MSQRPCSAIHLRFVKDIFVSVTKVLIIFVDEESVRKLAEVEITKAGVYTICLQLQPVSFQVDVGSKAVDSYPFGEDTGIKLRFQPGTFAKNPAKCITKVRSDNDRCIY